MSGFARSFARIMVLVALSIGALATAFAQEAKGEFILTKEVRWSGVTLPPGRYTYSLEHHASEILVVRPVNGGAGYLLMAGSTAKPRSSNADALRLEHRANSWYVSALTVHDLDEELLFAVPASSPEATRTPIASASLQ